MQLDKIKTLLQREAYDFLRTDPHLGDQIMLLGLGGSHAYGTETEGSDLDIRGIAAMSPRELLLGRDFEQVTDRTTDTVIYSFNKMIGLLVNTNPNTIEILGLKPEHYLWLSPAGKLLLENRKLFLSKRAIHSFGAYANAQLQRLNNKAVREAEQKEQERHILNTIRYASHSFPEKYFQPEDGAVRLYTDTSIREGFEEEIYMDLELRHYPLRDWLSMWSEMKEIARSFEKLGKRNQNAASHGKLGKHMMHLVRLYLMAFDILEKEEIITYRETDRDFLMEIRAGKYLDENDQVKPEFFELVEELEKRLAYDAEHTGLPEKVDEKKVEELVVEVNGMCCKF